MQDIYTAQAAALYGALYIAQDALIHAILLP